MSYTALYRKFRPQEFGDVKGQEHIVTTLKNQIKADRIGHAYLFCGTRGTGKTTVAKILAKAVNCEHPVDGNPCGECPTCQSITAGSSMNVIEIDAASNNGVDNIRQIKEEVEYRPTEGRYKVYIIDEVHMLSPGAFNALLKTLEEPPSYVIFILATTEAHKIPVTILSRCQRYDFHRISIDTITARLRELMDSEGVNVEDKALRYIARVGDGSMRDSLSLLDQCIAFYLGQDLTYDKVLETLGAVDTEVFSHILRYVADGNVAGAIGEFDKLVTDGKEPSQFVSDFTWYLRNLMLVQNSDDIEDVLDISAENMAMLKEDATMAEPQVIMRYIRIFSELSNQVRFATQKRVLIEVAIIKLCRPQMENDYGSLVDRVGGLEKKLENGIAVSEDIRGARQKSGADHGGEPVEKPKLPDAIPDDIRQVIKDWNIITLELSGVTRLYIKKALRTLGPDGSLLLVFDDKMECDYVAQNMSNCLDTLNQSIVDHIGKNVNIQIQMNNSGRPGNEIYPDLGELVHFDIEEEDF